MSKHFFEDVPETNKHRKRCPTSLVIREMQIRTTVRLHADEDCHDSERKRGRKEEGRKEKRKNERKKRRGRKISTSPLRREYKMGQPYENQLVRMLMWAGVQLRGRALA